MTLPWAPTQLLDSGSRWPCLRGPWVVRFPAPKYHSLSLLHGLHNSGAGVYHAITLELTRCYDDTWRSSTWKMIPQMIQHDMSCTDGDDRYTAIWYSAHVELQQYKKRWEICTVFQSLEFQEFWSENDHQVYLEECWAVNRKLYASFSAVVEWFLRGLWLERH